MLDHQATDKSKQPLLIVDGYNVIGASERYAERINPELDDPHELSRHALVSDVATFAQGRYKAVVVFDGARNLSPERPNIPEAGVEVLFSHTGHSADELIEKLAREARDEGRETLVVSSDNTIRSTIGGVPVTSISSALITREFDMADVEIDREANERATHHTTLGDRLSADEREKLLALFRKL